MSRQFMKWIGAVLAVLFLSGCQFSWNSIFGLQGSPTPTDTPSINALLPKGNTFSGKPTEVIDPDRLYGYLEKLTSIRPYAGWRNSASQGEADAINFVHDQLTEMPFLKSLGLELSNEKFRVFMSTQIYKNSFILSTPAGDLSIPVNALRGSRDKLKSALRLDSDGQVNDTQSNPITVEGEVLLVQNQGDLSAFEQGNLKGNIVLLNYALVDTVWESMAIENMMKVINAAPEGIVFVTEYSNEAGVSHGTYVGDLGVVSKIENEKSIPTLVMRIEDIPGEKGDGWKVLAASSNASMTWDTDVLAPGESGNLIARIPGRDHSRAILLSAHIDSANTPGALDDGSGSAILMEVAAVINESKIIPNYDLYLVWYGSEELGLLGSANFTASNQEILDRLIGMLNIDCLSRPVNGAPADLNVAFGSGSGGNADEDPWVNYLTEEAANIGINVNRVYLPLASDNSSFAGYNVANLDLIYDSEIMQEKFGGVWFAGHLHDPYDEVKLVREVDAQFQQMAQIAVMTALLPANLPSFREKTKDQPRVVFVASHTEDVLMTPAALFDLGMAFENAGMDVDTVPYGKELTSDDLKGASLVIALPVIDLPANDANAAYDESWQASEIEVMKEYVRSGGTLIITNSARRLKYYNTIYEPNEDWSEMNVLADEFGIKYTGTGNLPTSTTSINSSPFTKDLRYFGWYESNAVYLETSKGDILADVNGIPVLVSEKSGKGIVLVLSDLGMLSAYPNGLLNPQFVENLIAYAQ